MSGRAANNAQRNVIDLADDLPDTPLRKRQRRGEAGPVRNAHRSNGAQGGEQVIDLTHFPDRLVPHGGAAGHARHPHYMPADLHARRREHLARANWRPPMVPNGAAPGPDLLQRSPGVGVLRQRVQVVPAVHFPAPGARAAQENPPHSGKKKSGTTASPTPPQEESGPTCAICLDSLKDSLCCAPCGHVFHYKCLKEAIVKFKYCPTCRKPIKTEKTIKKIFL